ncbi:hypothetical protein I302_105638 [Kwoniella bestiolae CBS 10118]|uniref:Uncharacterized protein n=1 Tax=Kwoniella bestiolae CBS 10118 TaxID=1296100 RepID=A0A1B9G1P8_9TREE|nr:hypothetical protein I302_04756 [Kwoniella bestiolae CBS 10118]OCF24946.1 hypothetical protein I302_04756 [Kwoniella bestiolae CBS 10118]
MNPPSNDNSPSTDPMPLFELQDPRDIAKFSEHDRELIRLQLQLTRAGWTSSRTVIDVTRPEMQFQLGLKCGDLDSTLSELKNLLDQENQIEGMIDSTGTMGLSERDAM